MYMAPGTFQYYGSLGGLVAWQIAFFVIAADPVRYRLMLIPAMLEKFLWAGTLIWIYFQGGIPLAMLAGSTIPHGALGLLFFAAFLRTGGNQSTKRT